MKARIFGFISLIGVLLLFLCIAPFSPLFADATPDGPHSSISASPGELQADGSSTSTITVTLRDGGGTLITTGTVSLSASNGATVDQSSIGLGSSGTAIFTVRSTTVGTNTVTVTYNGTTVDNLSTQITFDTPVTPTYTPTPTPLNYCGDAAPGSIPRLLSAVGGYHTVTLTWSAASVPVTYYLVSYGTGSGQYQYGNPDVGNQTSYTVGNLANGTRYYFVVRAVNGCNPGSFSNELSAVAGTAVEPTATTTPSDNGSDTSQDSGTIPSDELPSDTPASTDTPTPTLTPTPTPIPTAVLGMSTKTVVYGGALLGFFLLAAVFIMNRSSIKSIPQPGPNSSNGAAPDATNIQEPPSQQEDTTQ